MAWLQKGKEFLPNISKAKLKKIYRAEKKATPQLRLLAAILRKESRTLDEISEILERSKTTIHDWLKRFQDHGLERRYDLKRPGKPPKLTKQQKELLDKVLQKSPEKQGLPFNIWTTSMVQYFILKSYGVVYTIRNIEYLVKELGFVFKKPRPQHRKANKKAQERFKIELKKSSTLHSMWIQDLLC